MRETIGKGLYWLGWGWIGLVVAIMVVGLHYGYLPRRVDPGIQLRRRGLACSLSGSCQGLLWWCDLEAALGKATTLTAPSQLADLDEAIRVTFSK